MTNSKNSEECLYISFAEPKEKRKHILKSVKSSLEVQEDILKLKDVRKAKIGLYKTLKKEMEELEEINKRVRAIFPNPNEVLPSIESETKIIEKDVNRLLGKKTSKQAPQKIVKPKKQKKEEEEEIVIPQVDEQKIIQEQEKEEEDSNKQEAILAKKTTHTKKLSKLDRIKNNIKLIEEELKKVK